MSDEWGDDAQAVAPEAASAAGPTAGMLLRQAREASGLHVAALAVALKVPVRKLEALEEDRYDLMTDAVFVRGLAASVCRTLKIDAQPILDRLPQTTAPRLVRDNEGINAPFRAPSDGPPASWTEQLTRPVFVAVFAILLAALVVVLVPVTHRDDAKVVATKPEPAAKAEVPGMPPPAAVVTPVSVPLATASEPVPALTAAASMPVPAVATAAPAASVPAAPVAAASSTVVAAAATVATPTPSAAEPVDGIVVFRAKGPSWVEVTDARGVVAVRKVLAAGEAAGASGALPLRVTVGRSDVTEVQVRGKPFDLKPHQRGDNVARFDVK